MKILKNIKLTIVAMFLMLSYPQYIYLVVKEIKNQFNKKNV